MRKNNRDKPITDKELNRDENYVHSIVDHNLFLKQELSDLNPISAGASLRKEENNRYGIHTLDCTNLYYIQQGKATLFINDMYYAVQAGDFFVVPLGSVAYLQSSEGALPHRWIGFVGTLARDFERFPIPFTLPPEIVDRLCDPAKEGRNLGSRLAADLFLIHSIMQEPEENKPDYVQKVVNLVNSSYMQKLSVSQIARDFGLDRSHLSRLFSKKMNMSIQEYIVMFRLAKAKRYLKHNYSITDTALLCGFGDRTNFTKVFTREIGCSPTEWRKIIDWQGWNNPR